MLLLDKTKKGVLFHMTDLAAALSHRMNHLIARQGVISGNIANADTPGYNARDLQFQPLVQRGGQTGALSLARTHGSHLDFANTPGNPGKQLESNGRLTWNKNGVQLDNEMMKLNDVQLNYGYITNLYSKHASLQRLALGRNQ